MHVIEKCVRGIRCLVVGQDASEKTFSDSPAELRLMPVKRLSRIPLLSTG